MIVLHFIFFIMENYWLTSAATLSSFYAFNSFCVGFAVVKGVYLCRMVSLKLLSVVLLNFKLRT